jgi:hypothetical protein
VPRLDCFLQWSALLWHPGRVFIFLGGVLGEQV